MDTVSKDKVKRLLRFLPMVAVMVMIFVFSAMPGKESGATSGFLLTIIVKTAEWVSRSSVSPDTAEMLHMIIRKAAHFTEFATLGITTVIAFWKPSISKIKNALIPFAVSVLYAASDEFHQLFVPGRAGMIRDVCIDSLGTLTGIVIILLCLPRDGGKSCNTI